MTIARQEADSKEQEAHIQRLISQAERINGVSLEIRQKTWDIEGAQPEKESEKGSALTSGLLHELGYRLDDIEHCLSEANNILVRVA